MFFLVAAACPVLGQVQLKPAEYNKWSELRPGMLSDKGNWASYSVHYDSADTLFIASTKDSRSYGFAAATDGVFYDERWFACKTEAAFELTDLISGTTEKLAAVDRFAFVNGKLLMENNSGRLTVKNLVNGTTRIYTGIAEWSVCPQGKTLAYVTSIESTVSIVLL